jgi:single-strand DNA-binding protein
VCTAKTDKTGQYLGKKTQRNQQMIEALISGKLIKTPEIRTGKTGNHYTQFLLSVSVGEEQPIVVSGIAFSDVAERIAKLGKGDAVSITGSIKPTEWSDKTTGEIKHGLSITVSEVLTPYDVTKRRKPVPNAKPPSKTAAYPFNDRIPI